MTAQTAPGTREAAGRSGGTFVSLVALACAGSMLVFGVWALLWPRSFAGWVDFPPFNEHLLHDLGAFQIGIGAGLLAALVWSDALSVSLLGFAVSGIIHAVNHTTDAHLGGHSADRWFLGALALLALAAVVVRARSQRRTTVAGGDR